MQDQHKNSVGHSVAQATRQTYNLMPIFMQMAAEIAAAKAINSGKQSFTLYPPFAVHPPSTNKSSPVI